MHALFVGVRLNDSFPDCLHGTNVTSEQSRRRLKPCDTNKTSGVKTRDKQQQGNHVRSFETVETINNYGITFLVAPLTTDWQLSCAWSTGFNHAFCSTDCGGALYALCAGSVGVASNSSQTMSQHFAFVLLIPKCNIGSVARPICRNRMYDNSTTLCCATWGNRHGSRGPPAARRRRGQPSNAHV